VNKGLNKSEKNRNTHNLVLPLQDSKQLR